MRILRLLLPVAATGAAAFLVAPLASAASASLTATFTQTSVWDSGYGAGFTIANRGDAAASGWVVEFDLPAGSSVSSSWDSVRTGSAQHYRFANVSWNGTIAAGGSVSFGFNVSGTGVPIGCLLNGAPCAGGGTSPAPTRSSPAPSSPAPSSPAPSSPPTSGSTVDVSTAAQLTAALANARPGQTIRLAPGTFANGYETHNPVAGSGCGNVWRDNVSDLGGAGRYAINVTSTSKCAGNLNVVYASNTVRNATIGLTNIAVTP
ncbi:cellulose binding domain-containing protein [Dactylosporangium sp. NPDC051484]|uniref:cellulose binding domain-containing protein n=1 Tax=Dactylosporangium sp. NPDC051484 TaxID=3154942 RepID=UPI00344EE30A